MPGARARPMPSCRRSTAFLPPGPPAPPRPPAAIDLRRVGTPDLGHVTLGHLDLGHLTWGQPVRRPQIQHKTRRFLSWDPRGAAASDITGILPRSTTGGGPPPVVEGSDPTFCVCAGRRP